MAKQNSPKSPASEAQGTAPGGLAAQVLENEVDEDLHPILKSLVENIKPIAIVFGILLLCVAGYGIYENQAEQAREKELNELGLILLKSSPQEKKAALEKYIAAAPEGMKLGAVLESALADMELGQWKDAAESWKEAAQARSDDKILAASAGISRAVSLAMAGEHAKAAEILAGLREDAPESFKNVVLKMLAVESEQAKDYGTALGAYQELLSDDKAGDREYYEFRAAELTRLTQGES